MKNQKGITLVALIITIVVMLILVTVSVTVALNTGMFEATQKAAGDMKSEQTNETKLSSGSVTVGSGDNTQELNLVTDNAANWTF